MTTHSKILCKKTILLRFKFKCLPSYSVSIYMGTIWLDHRGYTFDWLTNQLGLHQIKWNQMEFREKLFGFKTQFDSSFDLYMFVYFW